MIPFCDNDNEEEKWIPGPVSEESACFPHVYEGFLSHPKDTHVEYIGVLTWFQSEWVWGIVWAP